MVECCPDIWHQVSRAAAFPSIRKLKAHANPADEIRKALDLLCDFYIEAVRDMPGEDLHNLADPEQTIYALYKYNLHSWGWGGAVPDPSLAELHDIFNWTVRVRDYDQTHHRYWL